MSPFTRRSIATFSALLAISCTAGVDDPTAEGSKADAEALEGKADGFGADLCALYGWYDDGVCDTFCPSPDPECGGACVADSDCPPVFCLTPGCQQNTCNDGECGAPPPFCETTCAARPDAVRDGSGCGVESECLDFCQANVDSWSAVQREVLEGCVQQPLCYQTVAQCVNRQSYCETECGVRVGNLGCANDGDCMEFCGPRWDLWTADERAAFHTCLQQPLCYQTVDSCFASATR